MDIRIMSRNEAIVFSYKQNIPKCIIISISDTTDKHANFDRTNKNIIDVLPLFFDDVEIPIESCIPMCEFDAKLIVDFINKFKDQVDTIVVHCAAGISRSAGVACALSRVLNGDDSWIWNSRRYSPNCNCIKQTLKAFGIIPNDEEIKKLWQKLVNDENMML